MKIAHRLSVFTATRWCGAANRILRLFRLPLFMGLACSFLTAADRVTLAWIDNSNNEDGFRIQRADGASGFVQIAVVGSNVTTFSQDVASDVTYRYRVCAYNAAGNSAFTNEVSKIPATMITVTAAVTVSNKVYDGTTAAVISGRALQGVIGSDDVSLTGGTAAFADANAGASKTVNVTGLALTGAQAGKYQLSATSITTTGTITAVPLEVTARSATRMYGEVNPPLSVFFTGFVNGETQETAHISGVPGISTPASPSTPPGSYTIVPSLGSLSAANYIFSTFKPGALVITPAQLTVIADAKTRRYGAENPELTWTITGFGNGENMTTAGVTGSPSLAVSATTASPVGDYVITPAAGTLAATNYTFATFTPGKLTVTPAPLTITAQNVTRSYGTENPTFIASISGFVNGENMANAGVTGSPSLGTTASLSSAVGTYPITISAGSLAAKNYTFATLNPGVLTVAPAVLTVTADSISKTLGTANPTFTATISGFVNGQSLTTSGVSGLPAFTTVATAGSPVGTYSIKPEIGTLAATNYAFAEFVDGTLTITAEAVPPPPPPAAPAPTSDAPAFTLQPTSVSVPEGETATFTAQVTGSPAPALQWRKDGVPLSGATDAKLTLRNISSRNVGIYSVVASNSAGTSTSVNAALVLYSSSNPVGYLTTSQTAPAITTQPVSQAATSGQTVTFSVVAAGNPAPMYQWRKNGANISKATGTTLTLSSVQPDQAGSYDVVITNGVGTVRSNPAVLVINAPTGAGDYFGTFRGGGSWALYVRVDRTATYIAYLKQFSTAIVADFTVNADGTFSAAATAAAAATAVAPAGEPARAAAASTYTISGSILNGLVSGQVSGLAETFTGQQDTGSGSPVTGYFKAAALGTTSGTMYAIVGPSGQTLVVTVMADTVDVASGTVTAIGDVDLWTERGNRLAVAFDSAAHTLASTYVIPGGPTSITFASVGETTTARSALVNLSVRSMAGSGDEALIVGFVVSGGAKPYLIRGIGPTLTGFGVSGALDDPMMSLYAGGMLVGFNDDWETGGDPALIARTGSNAGAFALATGSRDAALLLTLSTGAYSAQINSKGFPGTALAELYDTSVLGGRLVNASARTTVDGRSNVLIAGFSIAGNAPKQVLVRAIGPGLGRFGVNGYLRDPQLEFFQGQTKLAENTNWGGRSTLTDAFNRVAAFALEPNSLDAALLITLQPGTYSAVVSGENNTSGIALVEVYEVF